MAVERVAELGAQSGSALPRRRRWPPEAGIFLVLVGMALAFELLGWILVGQSFLLNGQRLQVMILQVAVTGIIAVGVTQVIITGGIDLSSGSVLGMTAMIAASLAQRSDYARAVYPMLTDLPVIVPVLAGVLAGCMSKTGIVASVAGVDIPPVRRFVQGFEKGARAARPNVATLNQYVPDFNDPETGQVVAQGFISQGADVIFGVAGETGSGGLLAAHEAGVMAIGVDVDQYFAYPEVGPSLLTSASKNVDVAAAAAVRDFAAGQLEPGIRLATLANGGVGLAPYHDWEGRVPAGCHGQVEAARAAIIADPAVADLP